jgi:hypothetical protein
MSCKKIERKRVNGIEEKDRTEKIGCSMYTVRRKEEEVVRKRKGTHQEGKKKERR